MEDPVDLLQLKPGKELRERRVIADHVADALRDAIQTGALADGAILNQVAIADRFGVSRIPVREAMRQLQAEGLVTSEAHRRAVVRGLSVERIVEIYDLRALIEAYLIEKAVPNITPKIIEQAKAIEAKMAVTEDHAAWLDLNARFHDLLYRESGATTALELAAQLRARAERYVRLWSRGKGLHREKEVAQEHRRILRCVQKRDAAQASLELKRHIAHTRDRLMESNPGNGGHPEPVADSPARRAPRRSASARR